MTYNIRIGYACINTALRKYNIFTSRSPILKTVNDKGMEFIEKIALLNLDDLMTILIYNEAHGIRFFRISSNIFPHLGNPRLKGNGMYSLDFAKKKLKVIGAYAKVHGHRLTMHPGQFVQLGSPNPSVVAQSITDLMSHMIFLKAMGYAPTDGAVLIIHGGGTYGGKQATLARWKNTFANLPDSLKAYIVLENDEFAYGVEDLLPLCEELNIPFCLDVFHNSISDSRVEVTDELIQRILQTWQTRNIIPKVHVSEQEPGLRKGAHSRTLDKLPMYILELPAKFTTPLDIMLEIKDKEQSVFKMYHKYFCIEMDAVGRVSYGLKN